MDIQQKLTGFAMMGATWIMWLLVALSVGGVAVALERAIYLIVTRENVSSPRRSTVTGTAPRPPKSA
jgi:hypothetical protein